jgi:hypothetical protein
MFMAWLGKVNAYFLISFFFFTIYLISFEVIEPVILNWGWNSSVLFITGFIPIIYIILCIYLLLASLFFKSEKIMQKTNADVAHNTQTFFFISGILGIYQLMMFVIGIGYVVKNYVIDLGVNNGSNM